MATGIDRFPELTRTPSHWIDSTSTPRPDLASGLNSTQLMIYDLCIHGTNFAILLPSINRIIRKPQP